MFKKILVAIDGSETSLNALKHAIELQKITASEILLICVYKHHSLYEASLSIPRPDELDIPDQALREYASSVISHAKAYANELNAVNVHGFVKGGQPSAAIIEFAETNGVDLIVIGSHGTHSRDGMFLGSVANRVAAKTTCPILIV